MLWNGLYIFYFIAGFKLCLCQRRIAFGDENVSGKRYLVYFVKSPYSKSEDVSWRCGGALVSPTQILTAAECLVKMEKLYAIVGYKKYVKSQDINDDSCTKTRKQKVIKICVPKDYKLSAKKPVDWMNVDIGIAIVEKPYNFSDLSYRTQCSYEPQAININYEKQNEMEKTRAVVPRWGAMTEKNPSATALQDFDSQSLQEMTMVIVEKKTCANLATSDEMQQLLDKYLLCAEKIDLNTNWCSEGHNLTKGIDNNGCIDFELDLRRTKNETNILAPNRKLLIKSHLKTTRTTKTSTNTNTTSTAAIATENCQNDHGSPVIGSNGVQEMIIGVALNGVYNPNCTGPFLLVSTAETAKIIECLLATDTITRQFCNSELDDKRYEVDEIVIQWPEEEIETKRKGNFKKISSYLRQGSDDMPLHMRPTKDFDVDEYGLRTFDQHQERVYELQIKQKRAQPNDQPQDRAQDKRHLDQRKEQRREQPNRQAYGQPAEQLYQKGYERQYEQPIEQSNSYSYNQRQQEQYKQLNMESIKRPQGEPYNQPQMQLYKQDGTFIQPQIESFRQTQVEKNNRQQIESYKSPKSLAASSNYNQRQTDTLDLPQPQAESYDQPEISYHEKQVFKLPIVEPYKPPSPVEPYNKPSIEPYKTQAFKPAPVEPYLHEQSPVQALREVPRESSFDPIFDLQRDDDTKPQSFEQLYSQTHGSPSLVEPTLQQHQATELTFEEMFKNLHDPTFDLPHEEAFESPREPPPEQQFEQQFEQHFDQMSKQSNVQAHPQNTPRSLRELPDTERHAPVTEEAANQEQDEVKVRPQVPLDYQNDYGEEHYKRYERTFFK